LYSIVRLGTSLGYQWGDEFSERGPHFLNMPNTFKLCPTHFSRRSENFSGGVYPPASPYSYGPENNLERILN